MIRSKDRYEFNATVSMIHRGRMAWLLWLAAMSIACLPGSAAAVWLVAADAADSRADDRPIVTAMETAGGGYSVDEIVIDDQLREHFLAAIAADWKAKGNQWQRETLLRLVSLRKAGKLPSNTQSRGRAVDPNIGPIAEIAARSVFDRHPVSTDTLLCDPELRDELQAAAESISEAVDAYSVRKWVLRLRKTRQLRPELVLRVGDWQRTIESFSLDQLAGALREDRISSGAGVYIFRDAGGYLYIGEAANLRSRLKQHMAGSDRTSLKEYLQSQADGDITVEIHAFAAGSPGDQLAIRRAYESELIRSRQPQFNVRP
jgi:hypothetical protein